jgi:glycosyltransferase involved in cell wall biosynthesis
MKPRRLRILTWHVHGNYLYNLTQVPHDFYLATDAARSMHHSGRSGTLPWGPNVHEAPVETLRDMAFDVVMFQSRHEWDDAQHRLLGEAQRRLPRVYIEHDPPQVHPTDTRHWVDDPNVLLVHVTPFNALMWDSGATPTRVIEHGILPLQAASYSGHIARGVVVVNNLSSRGRRLGLDVYREVAARVPLNLYGMGSAEVGGDGEVVNDRLPGVMAAHRFFFNPIRWTSLGLAIIEAMMVGLPIVGLATTELVTVIRNGENGFIDTRLDRLVDAMQRLLADPGLARELGAAARRTAEERFGIDRFVADWLDALATVAG